MSFQMWIEAIFVPLATAAGLTGALALHTRGTDADHNPCLFELPATVLAHCSGIIGPLAWAWTSRTRDIA